MTICFKNTYCILYESESSNEIILLFRHLIDSYLRNINFIHMCNINLISLFHLRKFIILRNGFCYLLKLLPYFETYHFGWLFEINSFSTAEFLLWIGVLKMDRNMEIKFNAPLDNLTFIELDNQTEINDQNYCWLDLNVN